MNVINYVLIIQFVFLGNAYEMFLRRIPNGFNVPDPCSDGAKWMGVGHRNVAGGGLKNPFGIDFHKAGFKWTSDLCKSDSDGDGRSNGEELGDPTCVWKEDSTPTNINNITHPGIYEPLKNSGLRNSWLQCKNWKICPSMSEPGVKSTSFRLPRAKVPTAETTLTCKKFDLPGDNLYDVVASQPYIDNRALTHHVVFYACEDDLLVANRSEAWNCELMVRGCSTVIGVWAFGAVDSFCFSDEYGIRIGSNNEESSFRYAVLQVHYNNVERIEGEFDSTGMTVYYTPRLRPNRASILFTPQKGVFLPPRLPAIHQTASCKSYCTRRYLNGPVNITMAALHMHKTGIRGSIEQYRNGIFLREILPYEDFDFNSPKLTMFNQPKELLPGDELRVNCVYNTMGRNNVTAYGPSSSEEMCLGFVLYYPSQKYNHFTYCGSYKNIGICGSEKILEEPCNRTEAGILAEKIKLLCGNYFSCNSECNTTVNEYRALGCASDASYDLNELSDDARRVNDAMDTCAALSTCDVADSYVVGRQLAQSCDFSCGDECVRLIERFRRLACFDVAWKYVKRTMPMLSAYMMTCQNDLVGF